MLSCFSLPRSVGEELVAPEVTVGSPRLPRVRSVGYRANRDWPLARRRVATVLMGDTSTRGVSAAVQARTSVRRNRSHPTGAPVRMTTRFDTVAVVRSLLVHVRSTQHAACRPRPAAIGFSPRKPPATAKASCKKPTCDHDDTTRRGFDCLQLRYRPAGAGPRLSQFPGAGTIRRSRAVRPGRRRSQRSGQAERRPRRARDRPVRYRNRDQILPGGVGSITPGALPARPRLRRQPTDAGRRERLSQGGRQGQHVGHGRTRGDARDRVWRCQGRSAGAQTVRARRRRGQSPRRHQSRGAPEQRRRHRRIRPRPAPRRIPSRPEPCLPKRRRRIRPKRSISSD